MENIAIIPARGGSKRFPRKNIVDFLGKPIIAHTIQAALKSRLFSKVVVSTDDKEIASIAHKYGAEVDLRSAELATDSARVTDVCYELITRLVNAGEKYDLLCVLYATAPMRGHEDIENVIGLLDEGCDSAVAVTEFTHPVHQALEMAEDSSARAVFPHLLSSRSEEVPHYVVDNGSTYATYIEQFLATKRLLTENLKVYQMPFSKSQDIDYPEDLDLVNFFVQQK